MLPPPPIRVIAVAIAFVIDLVMPVLETRTGYPAGGQVTEAGLGSNIGGTPVSTRLAVWDYEAANEAYGVVVLVLFMS